MVLAAYVSRVGFKRLRNWAMGNNRRLRLDFGLLAIISGIILATGLEKNHHASHAHHPGWMAGTDHTLLKHDADLPAPSFTSTATGYQRT
jgi:hypothetical protein